MTRLATPFTRSTVAQLQSAPIDTTTIDADVATLRRAAATLPELGSGAGETSALDQISTDI